jgi:hypothetical protein
VNVNILPLALSLLCLGFTLVMAIPMLGPNAIWL